MSDRDRHTGTGAHGHVPACLRARVPLAALALVMLTTGCTGFDRALGTVPWFTTMRDQIGVRPFEAGLRGDSVARWLPPEGSISTRGREDSLDLFGPGLPAVDAMRNPVTMNLADPARGALIYQTYCTVCHGVQGRGDGPVAGRLGYVPDLTLDITRQRSDGYLYAIVRHGRGVMPPYGGDKIREPRDRWLVVHHVRTLQGAGAAPAPGAGQ